MWLIRTSARNVARTSPSALGLETDCAAPVAVAAVALALATPPEADTADEGSVWSLALIVSIGCSGMRAKAPDVALASMMGRSERDCSDDGFGLMGGLLGSDGLDGADGGCCGR